MNRKPTRRTVIGLVLCFLMFLPLLAQQEDSSLRDELDALKQGQEQIQRQIRLMREIEALKRGQSEIKKELEEIRGVLVQIGLSERKDQECATAMRPMLP